jgi:stearoyl-CoA desaturase (delta-9 desaturase)
MDAKFQHKPIWDGEINWTNSLFITITPILAIALMPAVLHRYGVSRWDFAIFSFMIFTTGVSLTAGYHRLFAHQAFEARPWVRAVFLFFGAGCIENSALSWSSDHRYHHRFVDKEGDPYNINKGFFWAHMGWIFFADPPARTRDNASDLESDPLLQLQHRYYLPLCAFVAFGLPTMLGFAVGRPLAALYWGGLFRLVFLQHLTFLINSACHKFGSRPYTTKHTARDCWWLAILTNGEGYHNFHHTFASDYRNGHLWYHFDLSKWVINSLAAVGLATNLKSTPDAVILKARMETSFEEFKAKRAEVPAQLVVAREALEAKLHEFQVKLREFQAWKESKVEKHARSRRVRMRLWKRRLRHERHALEAAVAEFRAQLRAFELQPSF